MFLCIMYKAAIVVLCVLALAVSTQAVLFSANNSSLICKNKTVEVQCNSTKQTTDYPTFCCNFGDGDICCDEIPKIIGIIVGAVVLCCFLFLVLPIVIILCACFCLGVACCGVSNSRMRIVKSGYKRV